MVNEKTINTIIQTICWVLVISGIIYMMNDFLQQFGLLQTADIIKLHMLQLKLFFEYGLKMGFLVFVYGGVVLSGSRYFYCQEPKTVGKFLTCAGVVIIVIAFIGNIYLDRLW